MRVLLLLKMKRNEMGGVETHKEVRTVISATHVQVSVSVSEQAGDRMLETSM